jgi:hypothetical protein
MSNYEWQKLDLHIALGSYWALAGTVTLYIIKGDNIFKPNQINFIMRCH